VLVAFVVHVTQLEVSEMARRQMQEKIGDLEWRLTHDVAASHDVDSLRAELQAAKTKIDQLQNDDNVTQYVATIHFRD